MQQVQSDEQQEGPIISALNVRPIVIIHVEGGLVQSVYSTEDLDIQVFDLDVSDFATRFEIADSIAMAADLKQKISNMRPIY